MTPAPHPAAGLRARMPWRSGPVGVVSSVRSSCRPGAGWGCAGWRLRLDEPVPLHSRLKRLDNHMALLCLAPGRGNSDLQAACWPAQTIRRALSRAAQWIRVALGRRDVGWLCFPVRLVRSPRGGLIPCREKGLQAIRWPAGNAMACCCGPGRGSRGSLEWLQRRQDSSAPQRMRLNPPVAAGNGAALVAAAPCAAVASGPSTLRCLA